MMAHKDRLNALAMDRIVGGFGLCGIPENSIQALVKQVRMSDFRL